MVSKLTLCSIIYIKSNFTCTCTIPCFLWLLMILTLNPVGCILIDVFSGLLLTVFRFWNSCQKLWVFCLLFYFYCMHTIQLTHVFSKSDELKLRLTQNFCLVLNFSLYIHVIILPVSWNWMSQILVMNWLKKLNLMQLFFM